MKAISLNLTHANYVAVDEKTYFLKRHPHSTQLLPTSCPIEAVRCTWAKSRRTGKA